MENSRKKIGTHANGMFGGIKDYVYNIFHIKEEVDFLGTITEIKKGLNFDGARAWVLLSAIFMASAGLNMGHMAIAVIIGAMLVAPLMSPILGAGVSLGTNDWMTLKKSSVSLLKAVGVSLVGSSVWFILSPINTASDALIVRTIPTVFDVAVAVFGGVACIITFSLKDKGLAATVIPGVAVGTSLMPPLCTAGFGIAHLDFTFFAGGFYLFLINAVFIALSAYVYVKFMKFEKVKIEDANTEKRYKKYIIISLLIIVIPSIWVFVGVVKDSVFQANSKQFVEDIVKYDGSNMISYNANRDSSLIEVFMIGEVVPLDVQKAWESSLNRYNLGGTSLYVSQSKEAIQGEHLSVDFIEQMYKDKDVQIHQKDEKIILLEEELSRHRKSSVDLLSIEKEIEINYNKIEKLSYNESMELNFNGTIDTIPTFMVEWEEGYNSSEDSEKLGTWLEYRLDIDSIRIVNY